jgi:hypothetical protein
MPRTLLNAFEGRIREGLQSLTYINSFFTDYGEVFSAMGYAGVKTRRTIPRGWKKTMVRGNEDDSSEDEHDSNEDDDEDNDEETIRTTKTMATTISSMPPVTTLLLIMALTTATRTGAVNSKCYTTRSGNIQNGNGYGLQPTAKRTMETTLVMNRMFRKSLCTPNFPRCLCDGNDILEIDDDWNHSTQRFNMRPVFKYVLPRMMDPVLPRMMDL